MILLHSKQPFVTTMFFPQTPDEKQYRSKPSVSNRTPSAAVICGKSTSKGLYTTVPVASLGRRDAAGRNARPRPDPTGDTPDASFQGSGWRSFDPPSKVRKPWKT
jgi:hypothetical protein